MAWVRKCLAWIFHSGKTNKGIDWVLGVIGMGAFYGGHYTIAEVCFVVAGIWGAGWWCNSGILRARAPIEYSTYDISSQKSIVKIKGGENYRLWQFVPLLMIACVLALILYGITSLEMRRDLQSLEGRLYPADEAVDTRCPPSEGELAIVNGTNTIKAKAFPHTVIAVDCADILVLDKSRDELISITAKVFDRNGKIILEIEKGHFVINANNVFGKSNMRPDKSTLTIFDQEDREVLYMHLANKRTLLLRAAMYYKGHLILIDDSHPLGSRIASYANSCFSNTIMADAQYGRCIR